MEHDERPELLTRQEASRRLRVSVSTLARMYEAGQIRSVKVGRGVRIPREDVDRMIAGLPPLPPAADDDDLSTWPPTPSLLAQLDGVRDTDAQAEDDAAAVRAATHRPGHP